MSKPASASDGTNGKTNHQPQLLHQVMISSTGSDLKGHRELLSSAINSHGLHPNIMEHDSAKLVDVIESSLEKVRNSAAYILIIGKRYGQTPECPDRNPDKLSITELEFNEAAKLGRPTLLFIMGTDHLVKECDVEADSEKRTKLNAFRERAKQQSPDSKVHRVYAVFNSLDEFTRQIAAPVANLQKFLEPSEPIITDPKHWEKLLSAPNSWDHYSSLQSWSVTDLDVIKNFLMKLRVQKQDDYLNGLKPAEQFRRFKFLAENGTLNNGAFLCFAESPSNIITGATTKCFHWNGLDNLSGYSHDIESRKSLLQQFDDTIAFITKALRLSRIITDKGREEYFEIPLDVLEEVIANALVHREYRTRRDGLKVSVYDDRIEIVSPGLPPFPLNISNIEKSSNSHPRNPQIARIFYLYGFVERAGSGIQRIKASLESKGLPKPEFIETPDKCVKVIIRRPIPTPAISVSPQTYRGRIIPTPSAFYAEPDYIGSHKFIGRETQLQELNDWAKAADPTNLLLLEAIGGSGKSILIWEWATKHATTVRSDWAGRFWYSFYERGAVMADFCRRALAYMTGRPMEELEKKKTLELSDDLIACLHEKPWLLILDGLERVLVAYHRIDAAEVPDEEANAPTDKILNRNPCDAIREEDSDLLRRLAGATPSKILVSSRLTPRALLNSTGQPIPDAKRITLPGLRPADAEALLRHCGITGNSEKIQEYLTQNCDNHPLIIGVLAALIANYLPDRGNFDAWVADASSQGGAYLNLATLDLVQRRNHILRAAFEALPDKSRQLLSTLALISSSVDYETLSAFNPHLPCEPEKVEKPELPEKKLFWKFMDEKQKKEAQEQYETELAKHREYEESLKQWRSSEAFREASGKLPETVRDLEQRGLLQYDGHARRHDLHPVVRGVAAGGMEAKESNHYGQRVIDHFSALPHRPYKEAKTLDEVAPALQVVRTLLKLGRFQEAADAYADELSEALLFNLEAHAETLSLLRPLFPSGWDKVPENLNTWSGSYLVSHVAFALDDLGEHETALAAYSANLIADLNKESWENSSVTLSNIAACLGNQNRLAMGHRINVLDHDLAVTIENKERLFRSLLSLFAYQSRFGQWREAASTWQKLDPMGRDWSRSAYRQGDAEYWFAVNQFLQGRLQEEHLTTVEQLAGNDRNRGKLRDIWRLRGEWRLEQQEWELAAESFHDALSMARERGLTDAESETGLALAKLQLKQFHSPDEARHEAERLSALRESAHQYLAMLWREIGDLEQAKKHALAAYKRAWADGEPYVHRYDLNKATELLRELNAPIPDLPPYDPAKDEPFPWEADVRKAIAKLKAEKEAEKKKS